MDSTFISFMTTTHLKEKSSHPILDLFFKKACEEFDQANELIERLAKEKMVSYGKMDMDTLENDDTYDFMRESIGDTQEYQSTQTCFTKTIDMTIDGYPIQISFYAKLEGDVEKYEEKYWKRMMRWILFLFKYKNKEKICFSRLHIKWFLFPIPKYFSFDEEDTYVIQPKHVNTGYTYPCNPTTDIILFREEDGFKVFMHETIHAFGIDLALSNIQSNEKHTFSFLNHYKINSREIISEVYARLYCSIEFIYHNNRKRREMNRYMQEMYFVTMYWSLFQGMRLLSISNTSFSSIFESRKRKTYKEKTYAFSYYIVTAIFLYKMYYTPNFFGKRKKKHSLDMLDLDHAKIKQYFETDVFLERKLKNIVTSMNTLDSSSAKKTNHIPLNMVIF